MALKIEDIAVPIEPFEEIPPEEKDRVRNSLYHSEQFGIPPDVAYELEPELNVEAFGREVLPFEPGKLFVDAFKQSLADKPAMMLRGAEVYTPGKALGIDTILDKSSLYLESLKNPKVTEKLQDVREGKLWPVGDERRWWQVEAKYLPETINAWSVNVADQIPIILTTLAGRKIGELVGKPVGAAAAAAWAAATGGPDPSDVATAPPVAAITQSVIKHLGGAAPLVAMEAGAFMDDAQALSIDKDIAEKYARPYSLGSGAIEYAQNLWILGRYARIGKFTKEAQRTVLREALSHIGGSVFEGIEEISQGGLERWLLGKAVAEMKERHPEYDKKAPKITEGWKREGAIGAGVAFLTGMPGTGMTIAQGQIARREVIKPETKEPVETLPPIEPAPEEAEKPPGLPVEPLKPTEPEIAPVEVKPPVEPEKPPEKPSVVKEKEVEIPEAEKVELRELEAREEGIEPYRMERVKGVGFVIKETLTGKEKVVIKKRKEAQARLTELNKRAKPIEPITRVIPKILKPETIEKLIPEPIALKAGLKKAAKASKLGYKLGVAETTQKARVAVDKVRMAGKMRMQNKLDAMNIIKTYVPKADQWRYMRRAIVTTTEANVEKLMGQIDEFLVKAEKRELDREFRSYVKGIRKEYKAGKRELGKLPPDTRERVQKLLEDIDLSKLSDAKQEKLEKREEWYNRISGALAEGFEALNQELDKEVTNALVIRRALIDELRRLHQTPVSEMESAEIRTILNAIKELVYYTEKKAESKLSRRLEILSGQLNSSRTEVSRKAEVKEPVGFVGVARYMLVEGAATLRSLINLATVKENSATRELLFESLARANNVRKTTYKKFINAWNKEIKKAGIKWSDLKLNEKATVTIGGKQVEATYNDLLSIYAHSQADENLGQILKTQGLNITTYGKVSKKSYRVDTPTLEELRTIENTLSNTQKKLVDIYFKVNREVVAPMLNETSMALWNYEIAYLEKYFHLSREIEVASGLLGKVFTPPEISSSIEEQGRYKFRTGGTARINIRPFMMEVMQGLQQDSFFHAMTESMENARTLISNRKWRQEMKKVGRTRELKAITTMIARIQVNSSDQSMIEQISMRLIGNAGKSILGLRISGGAVQVASLPVAKTVIDSKYFAGIGIQTKAEIEALMDKVPSLWIRWKAKQYDYAAGLATSINAFETLIFEHEPLIGKMLLPYTIGDQTAVYRIYKAAENQIEDKTELKRGTEKFDEAVLHLFDRAMETQPMWESMYRSLLTSSPHAWTRAFTVFMSARIAQHNVLLQSIDNEQKGRIDKSERNKNLGKVALANFYVSAFRHTVKNIIKYGGLAAMVALGLRPLPDEDELKEEAKRLATKLPQETVLNIVGLSPAGQVVSAAAYNMIRAIKVKGTKIQPRDLRSGNLLVDIAGDVIQTGMEGSLFAYYLFQPDEKWKSGPDEGDPKWIRYGTRFAYGVSLLTAYGLGITFEGPVSDIYYQLKNAYEPAGRTQPTGGPIGE